MTILTLVWLPFFGLGGRGFDLHRELGVYVLLDLIECRKPALFTTREYQLPVHDDVEDSFVGRFEGQVHPPVERHSIGGKELVDHFHCAWLVSARLTVCYLKIDHGSIEYCSKLLRI